MHDSLTIALLQAREAAMTYFLVLRLKPVNDQRKLYVMLTEQGQTLYARARSQVEEAYRKIEADFTPEKTQQLMLLLDDLIALGRQHPDSEAEA